MVVSLGVPIFRVLRYTPCQFSPLAEIPDSVELLENPSRLRGGVQRRNIIGCIVNKTMLICDFQFSSLSSFLCLHFTLQGTHTKKVYHSHTAL